MPALSVLIVEDSWTIAHLLAMLVERCGYRVAATASDLEQAMALVASEPLGAALLDIRLRRNEAVFPAADHLMARGVPFAFCTGARGEALPSRFAGYPTLAKPPTRLAIADLLAHFAADGVAYGGTHGVGHGVGHGVALHGSGSCGGERQDARKRVDDGLHDGPRDAASSDPGLEGVGVDE